MQRHLFPSMSLAALAAASGCLLETAVGPGAVSSDSPAAHTPAAPPGQARVPAAPAGRPAGGGAAPFAGEPGRASGSADQMPSEVAPPTDRPAEATDKKVSDNEPTINMTTGAPWQLEPETDAHRQGTLVQRPGPRAISRENPICDAAHNHCLHSNTWFVSNMPEEPVSQAQVAFRFDARFWRWSDVGQVGPYDRRYGEFVAYRTVPATVKNARPGVVIVFHRNGDNEDSHDPRFSNDARASENWHIGRIADVNAADGTFRFTEGKRFHPLAHARVAIETISLR